MIHGVINLPAMFIIMAISLLLIIGIQESARINAVIVVIKVTVVLVFIALGWAYINPANFTPFIPPNTGEIGSFGWSGILRGAGLVFFAFIGFDAVSTAAQEAKQAAKGHADRDHRIAGGVHHSVRAVRARADRHRELHAS